MTETDFGHEEDRSHVWRADVGLTDPHKGEIFNNRVLGDVMVCESVKT